MKARDVMTSPVITLRPDTPVHAAAALLIAHGFTAAPVVGPHRRLLGIATEADLVRGRVVPDGWTVQPGPEPAVAAVMTPDPTTARPDDDLADVVATMLDRGVGSVPVVEDGDLVGILSRRDVLRCVARRELTSAEVHRRRDLVEPAREDG
ncbi:CBS domain-containing protein [Pseudonocardia abyssalis]|jgi:CBS domain-containing protein|uniref:CBS domain-containing protein n=1 Tax=Pseudonocardia abyssalis TaxID=2792008 RepID=A0ABS6UNH0_9PSEU|nr:CBS domain-containing protein [Pseudonocardia abyssalis]MBW0119468.1 CBS domain-containing protein [Pseudonocardia abyssalis]MBW0133806.1 CBS domain-containing protein [Pseudonocardia abyssalis]